LKLYTHLQGSASGVPSHQSVDMLKKKEIFLMPDTQPEAEDVVLACLLTGEDLASRGEVVRPLMASYQQLQELEDGYAFQFPGESEWIQRVVTFVAEERECCPFFTFELHYEPNLVFSALTFAATPS
jgi:hypothetical protein